MKLIQEVNHQLESVIEEGDGGKRDLYITGIFMQTEAKNKNGRVYPRGMMEQKLYEYNEEFVKTCRAIGELEHPTTPQINLDRVSHLIKELKFDGNDIYGRAKILETPCGNIVRGLINGGAKLGVSSRGVGSVSMKNGLNEVQNDFRLITVDIVANPSAHAALVDGLMEGADWVCNNGVWVQQQVESARKLLDTKYSEENTIKVFESFMHSLRNRVV